MKKILSVLGLLILIIIIAIAPNSFEEIKQGLTRKDGVNSTVEKEDVLSSKAVETGENVADFEFENQSFRVAWLKVEDLNKIYLIPNFDEKLTASEILENDKCKNLVSGGFYTKENTPIGLFISDHETHNNYQSNNLLDGILSINDFSTPRITRQIPADNLRIGLQSGPILIENSYGTTLSIKNDEQARRIIAAVTGSNELYFLAVFDKKSVFLGPYLANLPDILEIIQDEAEITFADAINLDGGSASTFHTYNIKLSELTPVGSFFCIK